jgi:hypothetical protein
VFALLLQGLQEELQTTIPWVENVVHRLVSLALVVDGLVEGPRRRLPRWVAVAWLGYPAAWLAYTLVRGAAVDWHPYRLSTSRSTATQGSPPGVPSCWRGSPRARPRSCGSETGAQSRW